MSYRKVPIRSCMACGSKMPKGELIRVVRTSDGKVEVDPTGKRAGRGAYLCSNSTCWQAVAKGDRLSQALRGPISLEDKEKVLSSWDRISEEPAGKEGS